MAIDIIFSNRRITSRDILNIHGNIVLVNNNKTIEEPIEIVNISYNGMQVVFANDNFLYNYLDFINLRPDGEVKTNFIFDEKSYNFLHEIKWIRLHDIGEKSLYAQTALKYKNKNEIKEQLLDLITLLQMKDIYIG